MKRTKTRLLSMLLALCMVLSMLPAGIAAVEEATEEIPAITAVTANAEATAWPEGETQPGNITYMIPSVVFPDMNSPMETTFHMEISGLNPDALYIIRFNHETEEYSTLSPDENGVVALAYTAPVRFGWIAIRLLSSTVMPSYTVPLLLSMPRTLRFADAV